MQCKLALGLPAASLGQAVAPAAGAVDNLKEVTVTAPFRQPSLQTTPLAVGAVSGGLRAARNENNITQIANEAPSASLKRQGSAYGNSLGASIRGINQYDFYLDPQGVAPERHHDPGLHPEGPGESGPAVRVLAG